MISALKFSLNARVFPPVPADVSLSAAQIGWAVHIFITHDDWRNDSAVNFL